MTLQFGAGGGTPLFTTAPISGVPTLQVGTGTFAAGAAPDFQGISAIGVNMAAGYAQNLLDLQIAGVSKFSVKSGTVTFAVGTTFTTGSGAILLFPGSGNLQVNTAGKTVAMLGGGSQTADILSIQDSAPTNQFAIGNAGTGVSPLWAFRVAPVANAASMAQAHAGGASTGKAIQVIDNAGTTIGWLQLLA